MIQAMVIIRKLVTKHFSSNLSADIQKLAIKHNESVKQSIKQTPRLVITKSQNSGSATVQKLS